MHDLTRVTHVLERLSRDHRDRHEWNEAEAHSAVYDAERTALLFCEIVNRWKAMSDAFFDLHATHNPHRWYLPLTPGVCVGPPGNQRLLRYRHGEKGMVCDSLGAVSFVPLLGGIG